MSRFLQGITRGGEFIPAQPWREIEQEQTVGRLADRFKGVSEQIEQRRREPDGALPLGEARRLVDAVRAAGAEIRLGDEGTVRVKGADRLLDSTIARLREMKAEIVRVLEVEREGAV